MPSALHSPPCVTVRLTMAADVEQVRPVARAVRRFLSEQRAAEEDVVACELALVEACNNAVTHIDPERKPDGIDIEALCDANTIELRVHDRTAGFALPDAVELPPPESERGRGLFIMQSLMDSIEYSSAFGGNCMILRKFRAASSASIKTTAPHTFEELGRKLAESEQVISEMAEELSSCYESLSAIFRCGAELGRTNDLKGFSQALCRDLLQITDADWFVLRVLPEKESHLSVFAASEPLALPAVALEGQAAGVEREAAVTSRDVWFTAKTPLPAEDPLQQHGAPATGLVHPFFFADQLVGTLAVGKGSVGGRFTAAQVNVVHTFADFLAIQLLNARVREEQIRNKLVNHELEIARNIQRALLPKSFPALCRFSLAGHCESARQVGGDFYDVLQVNDQAVLLIIADVMGKGIPAAMFAAILRSLIRAAPELMTQPAALLARINRLLFDELSDVEMFITTQLAFVDLKNRQLIAASAGHCPLLLATGGNPHIFTLSPDGLPIGVLPDAAYADHTEELPRDCRVLLYTDGLTDAQNGRGEFFGQPRLARWFSDPARKGRSATDLKESLAGELRQFQGETPFTDDQSFLVLVESA